MKTQFLFFVLLFSCLLFSCKKDNLADYYTGTFSGFVSESGTPVVPIEIVFSPSTSNKKTIYIKMTSSNIDIIDVEGTIINKKIGEIEHQNTIMWGNIYEIYGHFSLDETGNNLDGDVSLTGSSDGFSYTIIADRQ